MNLLRDLYIVMSRPSRRQMCLKQDNCTSLENSLFIGFCFVYLLDKAYLPFTIKFQILLKVCNQAKWSHGMAAVPRVPFAVLGPCASATTESYLKWRAHSRPTLMTDTVMQSILWSQADTNSQIFHGHSCLPPPDLCIVVYVGNRMRFNKQSIDQSTPHPDNISANVRNCLFSHTIKNVLYMLNYKLRARYHITMCKTSLWFIAHMS